MILINFGHAITPNQQQAIGAVTNQPLGRVIDIKSQFDQMKSFAEQARSLVDAVGLRRRGIAVQAVKPGTQGVRCSVLGIRTERVR